MVKPAEELRGMRCVALNAAEHLILESLGDPRGVMIRGIRPDDRERIVKAFRALDLRSIYLRFFFHKKELGDEELHRLCEPGRAREVVQVATIGSGSQETIIGLGHYVRSGASADIAFIVEEDYRGRGIASSLLQHLTHIAREDGILQFEADVFAENTPMLNVLHHSGLRADVRASDGIVHVTLFLGDSLPNG
ncbi:MAG TPA: GNAT family N-acetyltransferase [Burkholderiales bacterium]|nr:GNAT family N-acetyltransferase [Burkholderiales bacterium]